MDRRGGGARRGRRRRRPAGRPGELTRTRPARAGDLAALQEVERAAGEALRGIGTPEVADDPPLPPAELARYQRDGRAWVAVDAADRPVGYLLVALVDDAAHVEQVSVHPRAARRGLGAALLDVAAVWAAERGLAALTLTTFADVAWNAPYYRRLGFDDVERLTPGLRRVVDEEAARGLARWPRVVMRRAAAAD